MKKVFLFASAIALCNTAMIAQTKSKTKTPDSKTKTENGVTKVKDASGKKVVSRPAPGFQLTASGLEYKIVRDIAGTNTPKVGDNVEMHINTHIGDSVLFNSRKLNNNQPVPFQIMAPSFKGDIVEGFMMMTPGDSAVFRLSVDSVKKAGAQLLPWMADGDMIDYEVVLVSVKSAEQMKKEADEKSSRQISIDEQLLQEYFKTNKLKPTKTASGLYYTITTPGTGETAKVGEQVTVNYTGKTLDGNLFDSNVDPKFNHVQPFPLMLGQGHVIKGWDEGLTYFKKGGKGTLYIPSGLAYGERSPSPQIPPNAVLVFDVEITNIEQPPVRMEKAGHSEEHNDADGHKH